MSDVGYIVYGITMCCGLGAILIAGISGLLFIAMSKGK